MTAFSLAAEVRRLVARLRTAGVPGFPGPYYHGYASRATLDLLVEEIGVGSARRGEDGVPDDAYLAFERVLFYPERRAYGYVEIVGQDGRKVWGGGPVYDLNK